PSLRPLASRRSSAMGQQRSWSTRSNVPPAAPVAPTTATTGRFMRRRSWPAGSRPRRLALLLGQLADRLLAREVDAAAVVDLDHLHHDLVAHLDHVLDLVFPIGWRLRSQWHWCAFTTRLQTINRSTKSSLGRIFYGGSA